MNRKIIIGALSASLILSTLTSSVAAVTSSVATQSASVNSSENKVTAEESKSIVSSFTAIKGLNNQSVLGADFTHYQQDLGWGKKYYNYKHEEVNPFELVKSQGINTISVKVAVNPDTSNTESAAYTLDSAVKTLKEAKAAGLKTNVVLFFSDNITYANAQNLPVGWTAENAAEKSLEYTKATLKTLSDNEVLPTMVTLGNEVNYNFLGLSADGGWNGFVALANLAQVVKAAGSEVALSVAAPNNATDIQWVLAKYNDAKVDYDYIGVNLYADREDINQYVETVRQTVEEKAPGKQTIVSNIRFARQNPEATANTDSQAQSIYNLLKATASEKNAGGLIYDEAEFVGSWYGFFNEEGVAQVSVATFAYALGNQVDLSGKTNSSNEPTIERDPYQYGDDTGLKGQQVTIKKVPNMSESTIRGMDIGSYLALKRAGVKFYDFDGKEQPLMKILKDNGVNYIRLRIWNDPKNEKGETYGGGDNSVETSLEIAKEAASYGLPVQVNFHYSDFWVDPAKQILPKAWQADADNPEKMMQNIYEFTKDTLQKFLDAGVNVGMVQVGNEITKGMAGIYNSRNNSDAPLVWTNPEQSETLNNYLKAGVKAVREVSPNSLVALQLESPNPVVFKQIMDAWDRGNVDYDILGSSSYPHWGNTMANTYAVQKLAADRGKLFAIMETSWLNSYMDGDGTPNAVGADYNLKQYEIGPQGQVDELTDLYNTVLSQPNGLGVFYWEPAWIPVKAGWNNWKYNKDIADIYGTGWASKGAVGYAPEDEMFYQGKPSWGGSSWDNQGLFDISGYALQSLKFYSESITQAPVQTTQLKLIDEKGKVIRSIFLTVPVGKTDTVTLPHMRGYDALDGKYSYQVTGEVSGTKIIEVKYGANSLNFDGDYYYDENGQQVFSQWVFNRYYNSWFYIKADGRYARNEWVGDYYLKNGGYMAKSEWIYDNNYQSWFYLKEDGRYARNEWIGDYYLKNGGNLAKSEWIYDNNYQSWFYLHGNGTYARNEWIGDYYLKNGGYMAKSEWIYDNNYQSWFYLKGDGRYARNEWVGDYYLKNGGYMAKSEWIYDNNYQSWFYLKEDGRYARNEWIGDYYMKNGGYMAKLEWIYDNNYQSWYCLQANGAYARNTWVNDKGTWYFLKADGKMAKSEWVGDYYMNAAGAMLVNTVTPDGYRVDSSGKWG